MDETVPLTVQDQGGNRDPGQKNTDIVFNGSWADVHENPLDGVVAVALPVPLGRRRLGSAGEVGGPCPDAVRPGLFDGGVQFPPLPPVWLAFAHETGILPGFVVEADLNAHNGGGS
jgi:hypothetical protein